MDKRLLIRFEETMGRVKECMKECSEATGVIGSDLGEDKLLTTDKLERAYLAIENLSRSLSDCRQQYTELTGDEYTCEDLEAADKELERLKEAKLRETAGEFLDLTTEVEDLQTPLADAKEMLQVLLQTGADEKASDEDEESLARYAEFVEKYRNMDSLTSKERYNLMRSLSPLLGEDLVIGAFMDRALTGLKEDSFQECSCTGGEEGSAGTGSADAGTPDTSSADAAPSDTGTSEKAGASETSAKDSDEEIEEEFSFEEEADDQETVSADDAVDPPSDDETALDDAGSDEDGIEEFEFLDTDEGGEDSEGLEIDSDEFEFED